MELVLEKTEEVLVGGLNIFKKHSKPRKEGDRGGIIEKSRPIDVAKIALICSECGRATRVGYQIADNKKKRICLKCKKEV